MTVETIAQVIVPHLPARCEIKIGP